jgi:uroporphyrinogen III methyltransferase/synthase
MRILITASAALQGRAAESVRRYAGRPVPLPLVEPVLVSDTKDVLGDLQEFDWLILSSPSAVELLVAGMRREAIDLRRLPSVLAAGPGTAAALREHGLFADRVPERDFGTEGILREVEAIRGDGGRLRFLRLRSDAAGETLSESLRKAGAEIEDRLLYETRLLRPETLPPFDAVFFASSSAVASFEAAFGMAALTDRDVVAIGEPTRGALEDRGVKGVIMGAAATTEGAMAALAAAETERRLRLIDERVSP